MKGTNNNKSKTTIPLKDKWTEAKDKVHDLFQEGFISKDVYDLRIRNITLEEHSVSNDIKCQQKEDNKKLLDLTSEGGPKEKKVISEKPFSLEKDGDFFNTGGLLDSFMKRQGVKETKVVASLIDYFNRVSGRRPDDLPTFKLSSRSVVKMAPYPSKEKLKYYLKIGIQREELDDALKLIRGDVREVGLKQTPEYIISFIREKDIPFPVMEKEYQTDKNGVHGIATYIPLNKTPEEQQIVIQWVLNVSLRRIFQDTDPVNFQKGKYIEYAWEMSRASGILKMYFKKYQ